MATTLDVAALVADMSDTLSAIRLTIEALSSTDHHARLDQIEHQRDSTIAALCANFERERDDLAAQRRRETEEVEERRRREDEEIRERRRKEDEDRAARNALEDDEREQRLMNETEDVEDEMDSLMDSVEADAQTVLDDGRDKLARLEARRKELNRLIDEQLSAPLPSLPTRRRSRNPRTVETAITSKPPETTQATPGEAVNNRVKATEPVNKEKPQMRIPEEMPSQLAGRGSMELGRGLDIPREIPTTSTAKHGRTPSNSVSDQKGNRMSALGWFAGKFKLGDSRTEPVVSEVPDQQTDDQPNENEYAHDARSLPPVQHQELPREVPPVTEAVPSLVPVEQQVAEAQIHHRADESLEDGFLDEYPQRSPQISNETIDGQAVIIEDPTHGYAEVIEDHSDDRVHMGLDHDVPSASTPDLAHKAEIDSPHPSESDSSELHDHDPVSLDHQQKDVEAQYEPIPSPSKLPSAAGDQEGQSNGGELHHDVYYSDDLVQQEHVGEVRSAGYAVRSPIFEQHPSSPAAGDAIEEPLDDYQSAPQPNRPVTPKNDVKEENLATPVSQPESDYGGQNHHGRPSSAFSEPVYSDVDASESESYREDSDWKRNDLESSIHSPSEGLSLDRELESTTTQSRGVTPTMTGQGGGLLSREAAVYHEEDLDTEYVQEGVQHYTADLQDASQEQVESEDQTTRPVSPLAQPLATDVPYSPTGAGADSRSMADDTRHQRILTENDEYPYSSAQDHRQVTSLTETTTDISESDFEPEDGEEEVFSAPAEPQELKPVKVTSYPLDYSPGPETVQLPDSTWSVGWCSEEVYSEMVSRYMMAKLLEPESEREVKIGSPRLPGPLDGAAWVFPNDAFEPNGNEEAETPSASSALSLADYGQQPVVSQLGHGAWVTDPDDSVFDASFEHLGVASHHSIPEGIESSSHDDKEGTPRQLVDHVAIVDITRDIQSLTLQLGDGTWVTDPTDEEYKSALGFVQNTASGSAPILESASSTSTVESYDGEEPEEDTLDDMHAPDALVSEPVLARDDMSPDHLQENPVVKSGHIVEDTILQQDHRGDEGSEVDVEMEREREMAPYHSTDPATDQPHDLPWSPFGRGPSEVVHLEESSPVQETQPALLARVAESDTSEPPHDLSPTHSYYEPPYSPQESSHRSLNPVTADTTTDTESQAFVTPLQSAGMHTPPQFQDHSVLYQGPPEHANSGALEDHAATVNGQDDLFDSDDESEYESQEDGGAHGGPYGTHLGMPPQAASSYQGETLLTPDEAAETPTAESTSTNLRLQTQEPDAQDFLEDDADVSPLSLREHAPALPAPRGLAFSRHNPDRPATPPSQMTPGMTGGDPGSDGMWDSAGQMDSTPMSLVSQSTISSSSESPVHAALHIDNHEPVIRDSWPAPLQDFNDGQFPQPYTDLRDDGYVTTRYLDEPPKGLEESPLPTPTATQMPRSAAPKYSEAAAPSPSTLIQRMRNIFETQGPQSRSGSVTSSPVRSRPSSGIFNNPPLRRAVTSFEGGYDSDGERRKGGFLNEAEDDIDEQRTGVTLPMSKVSKGAGSGKAAEKGGPVIPVRVSSLRRFSIRKRIKLMETIKEELGEAVMEQERDTPPQPGQAVICRPLWHDGASSSTSVTPLLSEPSTGAYRLAWMWVKGWQSRIATAGEIMREEQRDWTPEDGRQWSMRAGLNANLKVGDARAGRGVVVVRKGLR